MKVTLEADGRTAAGGTPLLCHNERLADPLDEVTRAIAAISKKRNKTEANHEEIARLECFGGLYMHPPLTLNGNGNGSVARGPGVPGWNVLRCLQDGASRHKRGKDVLRGIYPLDEFADLVYDGPRDPANLWQEGWWLRKTVGVQRSRTVRTRPLFPEWQVAVPIEVDMAIWDLDTLRVCWRDAGLYAGLGDMRPVYGRFAGTIQVSE